MYLRRSKRLSEDLKVRYTQEYDSLIREILRLIQLIIQPEQYTYFMTSDRFIEIRFNHMELCIKKINSKLPFIVYFHKTKSVQVNKFMKFIKAQTINWNKEIQTLIRVNDTDEDDDDEESRDDDTDDSYMVQMMMRIMKNCSKFHKKYEEYRYDYWGYIINKYTGEEHIISIIDEYL